jgi:hypothetical protein
MKKVMRLTESDLSKIIKIIIKEDEDTNWRRDYGFEDEESYESHFEKVDEYANQLIWEVEDKIGEALFNCFEKLDLGSIITKQQEMFKERYPEYSYPGKFFNEYVDDLLTANTNPDSEVLVDKIIDGGNEKLISYLFYNNK